MKPTKEMIEAVKYMAKTGKCFKIAYDTCENCPGANKDKDAMFACVDGWSNVDVGANIFDKTLQNSAKNWLKENGVKDEIL